MCCGLSFQHLRNSQRKVRVLLSNNGCFEITTLLRELQIMVGGLLALFIMITQEKEGSSHDFHVFERSRSWTTASFCALVCTSKGWEYRVDTKCMFCVPWIQNTLVSITMMWQWHGGRNFWSTGSAINQPISILQVFTKHCFSMTSKVLHFLSAPYFHL